MFWDRRSIQYQMLFRGDANKQIVWPMNKTIKDSSGITMCIKKVWNFISNDRKLKRVQSKTIYQKKVIKAGK